jgi:hypothetical protein
MVFKKRGQLLIYILRVTGGDTTGLVLIYWLYFYKKTHLGAFFPISVDRITFSDTLLPFWIINFKPYNENIILVPLKFDNNF